MKLLPKSRYNPNGFTLVELLVVISIIAILSVIGITLFSNVQKNARDSKRRADVDSIAKALEAHYDSVKGTYSALDQGWFSGASVPVDSTGGGITVYCWYATNVTLPDNPSAWTTTCPAGWGAPIHGGGGTATKFRVCASLETGGVYCKQNQQ